MVLSSSMQCTTGLTAACHEQVGLLLSLQVNWNFLSVATSSSYSGRASQCYMPVYSSVVCCRVYVATWEGYENSWMQAVGIPWILQSIKYKSQLSTNRSESTAWPLHGQCSWLYPHAVKGQECMGGKSLHLLQGRHWSIFLAMIR